VTAVNAGELRRALAAVLPHVGDDFTLPILTCIQVTRDATHLTFEATDRYSFAAYRIPVAEGDPWRFLMHGSDAKELLARVTALSKPPPLCDAECCEDSDYPAHYPLMRVHCEDGWLSVTGALRAVRYATAADYGLFPVTTKLFADAEAAPGQVGEILLNLALLAKFASDQQWNEPALLQFGEGPLKSVRVTIGDRFTGLLMPVKPSEVQS